MISLPVHRLPLSFPGSLLGVSAETRSDPMAFHVRGLHRFADPRDLLSIGLYGRGNPATAKLTPEHLRLEWPDGQVEIVFASADALRLRSTGGILELRPADSPATLDAGNDSADIAFPELNLRFRIDALRGVLEEVDGSLRLHPTEGVAELRVTERHADTAPDSGETFDALCAARTKEFNTWHDRFFLAWPEADPDARREAAWLFRCCQAGPRGELRRPAVLMSKNWMTAIWSWDNAFNAVALAAVDPELARHQMLFFFDHQAEDGRLPDFVNVFDVNRGLTKPPVWGWLHRRLRERVPAFAAPKRLEEVYGPFARQARFWLETRDSDGDGLPEYHHGCDSGWDNGTGFIDTVPCASPDLAGWLILLLEELAWMAGRLNRTDEAAAWQAAADRLVDAVSTVCWDGTRWRAVRAGDHRPSPAGDSLLPWLVGMAGHRLTDSHRRAVAAALSEEGRFLASAGVATESRRSPLYEADGYWRGPVWGPSTVMAVEAARACGAPRLAAEIARRFLRVAPVHGFAENHDADTGAGLRDPGYTWTAAAWLILQPVSNV